MLRRSDLRVPRDETLGEEKAGGEFEVVTRSSHGDADRGVTNTNLKRLFAGKIIVQQANFAVAPFLDPGERDHARKQNELPLAQPWPRAEIRAYTNSETTRFAIVPSATASAAE